MSPRRTVLTLAVCAALAAQANAQPVPEANLSRDPMLESLIAASIANNPLVNSRRNEVAAARHDIDSARWQYVPTLSSTLQSGTGPSYNYGSALRADQKLYTGGRIDADYNAAVSRRDSAVLSVQETALQAALDTVTAWQTLQAAQGQQQAIADYRKQLDAFDASIRRRIASGVSPQSEQALMSARLAQSANDSSSARSTGQQAIASLRRLAGDAAAAPLAAETGKEPVLLTEAPAAPAVCADDNLGDMALQAAVDRHPAIQRMTQDIESARFQLEGQRAQTRPTVTMRLEQPVGAALPGVNRSARVSLLLEYSTDAAFAGATRVDAGGERLVGLMNQTQAMRRQIGQQILSECADRASVAERVAGFAKARAFTSDVLASYARLFTAGKRQWLDVLNAAREDFDNEQGAYGATASLRASQYRLALLTGDYGLGLPGVKDEPAPGSLFATRKPSVVVPAELPKPVLASATPTSATAAPVQPAKVIELAEVPPMAASAPEPAPAASEADARIAKDGAAIGTAIAAWAEAWARRDVPAYASAYSADFAGSKASHAAWLKERTLRIESKKRIEVGISNLQAAMRGEQAVVTFTQRYVGDALIQTTRKQLVLSQEQGAWRITEETEL